MGQSSQGADNIRNFVFLEQPDRRDAHGARFETLCNVVQGDSAQGKHGNSFLASFTQGREAYGWNSRPIPFLEDGSKDYEVGPFGLGAKDFSLRMTRYGDKRCATREFRTPSKRLRPDSSDLPGGNVIRAKMNAVSARSEGYVGAGVDQNSGSQFPVLSSQLPNNTHGLAGELLQVSRAQIFLPKLDVIDASKRRLGDLVQQAATSGRFVAGKLRTVGDVVKQTAASHLLSAYYERRSGLIVFSDCSLFRGVAVLGGRSSCHRWLRREQL
jgi:hypothetical protein